MAINPALIKDCHEPIIQGSTWRDVAVLATEQRSSITECNTRLKGIRDVLKQGNPLQDPQ